MPPVAAAFALALASGVAWAQRAPMRVDASGRVATGRHTIPVADGAALVAEGLRNAVIDLSGVALDGGAGGERDRATGFGLWLVDCEDVRVVGGEIRGYRECVRVERSRRVVIDGVRCEEYFAQRLESTDAAEHPTDRLDAAGASPRELLARYGAAIALVDCAEVEVRRSRARGGQNGLVAIACDGARIYDNDFSYLSGWGIAIDGSSDCTVARNRCDACARGFAPSWSHPQGAAGIRVTGVSRGVVIALNSAAQCGAGIAIEGPSPENGEGSLRSSGHVVYQNEVSGAGGCGIEIRFASDVRVVENRAEACGRDGIAASDARSIALALNSVWRASSSGIALERAGPAYAGRNALHDCAVGLRVDGASRARREGAAGADGTWIEGNSFDANDADLSIAAAREIAFSSNVFAPGAGELRLHGSSADGASDVDGRALLRGLAGSMPTGQISGSALVRWSDAPEDLAAPLALDPSSLPGSTRPYGSHSARRAAVVVGCFGPWDPESGAPRPSRGAAGGALAHATWDARWFSWAAGPDPRGGAGELARWRALAASPAFSAEVGAWSSPWADRTDAERAVGAERFGLVARASVDVAGGLYELRVTSDDGVRVAIDGRTVLENWTWHAPTFDTARMELAPGRHDFVLEYFQVDGGTALTIDLEPVSG
jgi:nitrous oxidase accessory protein NosD